MSRAANDLDIFFSKEAHTGAKLKPTTEAVLSDDFWHSRRARGLRILCEMQETMERMEEEGVAGTFMFFGSARAKPTADINQLIAESEAKIASGTLDPAETATIELEINRLKSLLWLAPYFDITEKCAHDLSEWALKHTNVESLAVQSGWCTRLTHSPAAPPRASPRAPSNPPQSLFVSTGGGPGLMLAANKGAFDAGARSIGLGVVLPFEPGVNKFVSPSLAFTYQYFFTRKFWMLHQATALVAAPGGFGTLDELFEAMALRCNGKVGMLPIVLLGSKFWSDVFDLDVLVRFGVVSQDDRDAIVSFDTADDATHYVIRNIVPPVPPTAAVVPDTAKPAVVASAVASAVAKTGPAVAAIGRGVARDVASPVAAEPPMIFPRPRVTRTSASPTAHTAPAAPENWEEHFATGAPTEQPFGSPQKGLRASVGVFSPAGGGVAAGVEARAADLRDATLSAQALSPAGRPSAGGDDDRSDASVDMSGDDGGPCHAETDFGASSLMSPIVAETGDGAGADAAGAPRGSKEKEEVAAPYGAHGMAEYVPVAPAFKNATFLGGSGALHIRILAEFEDAFRRLEARRVYGTYNFFGFPLLPAEERWDQVRSQLLSVAAASGGELSPAGVAAAAMERRDSLRGVYSTIRELAARLTRRALEKANDDGQRYYVCTDGGPGVDEAANRGAADVGGMSIGMGVLGHSGRPAVNGFVSDGLNFVFRYPFARKFWSVYLSKAVVVAPGAWDTLDQLFEILTLKQTGKLGDPRLPIVLIGKEFWDKFMNWEALVDYGVVSRRDIERDNFLVTDSVDEAFESVGRRATCDTPRLCVSVCRCPRYPLPILPLSPPPSWYRERSYSNLLLHPPQHHHQHPLHPRYITSRVSV